MTGPQSSQPEKVKVPRIPDRIVSLDQSAVIGMVVYNIMNNLGDQEGLAPVTAFMVAGDLAAASFLAPADSVIVLPAPALALEPFALPVDHPQRIDPRWWLLALAFGAVLWTLILHSI